MDASAEHRVRDVPISFSADVAAAAASTRGAAPRFSETRRSYVALASSLHGTSVAEKGTARAIRVVESLEEHTALLVLERDARAGGGFAHLRASCRVFFSRLPSSL